MHTANILIPRLIHISLWLGMCMNEPIKNKTDDNNDDEMMIVMIFMEVK